MLTVYLASQAALWTFWGLVVFFTREKPRPVDANGFDAGLLDHEAREVGARYRDLRLWAGVFGLQVAWPLALLYLQQ